MALQVVLLGESLVAQVALIGPVPSVQVHVVLEVVAMQEAGWAVWARVGAFSCVLPHVDLQLVVPSTSKGKRVNIQDSGEAPQPILAVLAGLVSLGSHCCFPITDGYSPLSDWPLR